MLRVIDLHKNYTAKCKGGKKTTVEAVCGVSLTLEDDHSYALVGESGSGKSTLAQMLACLTKPTHGEIQLDNQNLLELSPAALRHARAGFQLVMQDGLSALDPRCSVYECIAEPLRNFCKIDKNAEQIIVKLLMKKVQLSGDMQNRLPHQLSGGQQKRVCIARAIAPSPKLIIFDESVSGLDVTVRKKILDLLLELREELQSTYLFITHDIDVAMYMAKNILVMKNGKIVENIKNIESYTDFKHSYSKMLIESLPPDSPAYRLSQTVCSHK